MSSRFAEERTLFRSKGTLRPALTRSLAGLALVLWGADALAGRVHQVTVQDLLTEPDRWHGRAVVVSGSVGKLVPHLSRRGNPYYTFFLDDGAASVKVFAYGVPEVAEGRRVRVEGTFLKVKRVGSSTYRNQVDARRISVP